ncbi:MAG: chalcone isomerase family protein, partial [Lentisphaeria bacterium]
SIMAVLFMTSMAEARNVSGKNIPETMKAGDHSLLLSGVGIRKKMWLLIYAAGLYLPEKMNDAQKIINADKPMAIKIHVISGLMSAKKMENALREGFEKSTNGNLSPIKDRMEKFIAAQTTEVNTDDVFEYVYIPKEGVSVFFKGKLVTTVKGLDFKKAVFGIWLGKDAGDKNLKKGLLNN